MYVFAPLLILHAIIEAAAITDPTTRRITTATTTTPMTAPDTCDGSPPSPGAGGNRDGSMLLLSGRDSSAAVDWSNKDAGCGDALPLGKTFVCSITGVAVAIEVLVKVVNVDFTAVTELLETSAAAYYNHRKHMNIANSVKCTLNLKDKLKIEVCSYIAKTIRL